MNGVLKSTVSELVWKNWGKTQKTLVSITNVCAKIENGSPYTHNTAQQAGEYTTIYPIQHLHKWRSVLTAGILSETSQS
jgi:hypothetical protein